MGLKEENGRAAVMLVNDTVGLKDKMTYFSSIDYAFNAVLSFDSLSQ